VRKIALVGLIVGLFSLSAFAGESDHPKAEFYGGYQYSHMEGGFNASGFNFGATGNLSNSFGITADFGSSFNTTNGVSLKNYTYTFGPHRWGSCLGLTRRCYRNWQRDGIVGRWRSGHQLQSLHGVPRGWGLDDAPQQRQHQQQELPHADRRRVQVLTIGSKA
jgi:hypothetical protein